MIDSFVTYSGQEAFAATLAALRSSEMINECFVLNMGDAEVAVDGCKTLAVDALTSTAAIKAIAEASQSKYTLIYSNGDVLKLGLHALKRMVQIADDSDETRRRLIIEYNDVRIGEMSFYVFENHRYEIGIKICESDYQEKGIGRVVLSMLIEELFRMGANVIFLDTNLKNTRAQHVYEKLGFRKTAVHYNSWKNQLGEMESSVDYELTADEFCNLK